LYIKNRTIKLDYKIARGIPINSNSNYGEEGPYKGLSIEDKKKVIYLYKTDEKVGKYLNKSVYIDSAGVSHNITPDKLNVKIKESIEDINNEDNNIYKEYKDYCYGGSALTDNDSTLKNDSVAKYHVDGDKQQFYINDEQLKNIYPSEGECLNGNKNVSLKLKKNEFNSNYGACDTNPRNLTMININDYEKIINGMASNNRFDDTKCDKKHIFLGAINRFKNSRNTFRDKFKKMIELFNELNESELKMLDGTQESIENLKKTIEEYDKLYKLAKINERKRVIINAQTNDMEIEYKNSQRKMAAAGIGAIGAVLLMFNYMKNS
jgi:hypothetical protein